MDYQEKIKRSYYCTYLFNIFFVIYKMTEWVIQNMPAKEYLQVKSSNFSFTAKLSISYIKHNILYWSLMGREAWIDVLLVALPFLQTQYPALDV